MKRAFPGGVGIRMPRVEAEHLASVLQNEPQVPRSHAGTHPSIVTLDQGEHVASLIGNGQINRIPSVQTRRFPERKFQGGLLPIDECPTSVSIGLRNQLGYRNIGEVWVSVKVRPVLEREFFCLNQEM